MIKEDDVYKIGKVTRTHGVKGEVTMSFTDDVWDRCDADYLILRVDGILVPFFIEEYRFRSDTTALIKFVDYDNSDDAQELCNADVYFPFSLTEAPGENAEYTWRYFTGFKVIDTKAGPLGCIDHVDDSTPNVLFCIGDLMVPAAENLVKEINHRERTITMSLPEGLLEIQ